MMGIQVKLKWEYLFSLSQLEASNENLSKKGVYLWMYKNKKFNRIIYVGTATGEFGYRKRIGEHLGAIKVGLETIFRVEDYEDPYLLLKKYKPEIDEPKYRGKFYYPEDKKQIPDWVDEYASKFLSSVSLWICPFDDEDQMNYKCRALEAQLINAFKIYYEIGYLKNQKNLSWIGKREIKIENALMYSFEFPNDNLPDDGEKSVKILTNLKNFQG